MSISGIGSNVIRDYATVYGSKAATSYPRSGEAKEPVADKAVKTYREQDAIPVYAERVQQTDELAAQNSGTTFPISSVIAKYEKYAKAIDEHYVIILTLGSHRSHTWDPP